MFLEFFTDPIVLWLIIAGVFIGIWGVVIGASSFLSFPLFQLLLPWVPFGSIVGNSKVGSLFRGIGSTIQTRKDIEWGTCLKISIAPILGSVAGATVIAQLDQRWLLPAIIFAVFLAEFAPKISTSLLWGQGFMLDFWERAFLF
jgi:uncharacterized membrane protein YfcA